MEHQSARDGLGRPDRGLLPGTGGHLEAYARNLAAFAQQYRVVAYDYPGHGYTTFADHDLELHHYVEHLLGLLDTLGIDRAHLNGESLGGWLAVEIRCGTPRARSASSSSTFPGGTMSRPETMEALRSLSQAAADDPTPEQDPRPAGVADGRQVVGHR